MAKRPTVKHATCSASVTESMVDGRNRTSHASIAACNHNTASGRPNHHCRRMRMPMTDAPAHMTSGTKTTTPKSIHAVAMAPPTLLSPARRAVMEARTGSNMLTMISTPTMLFSPSISLNGRPSSTTASVSRVNRNDSFATIGLKIQIKGAMASTPSRPCL